MVDGTDMDFSLADLADVDVSDIQEIRSSSLPAGAYEFKIAKAELGEGVNRDQEKRFFLEVQLEVLEVKAVVEKGVDKADLIGKKHSEKLYIVPEKAEEGIGRIRAWVADVGMDNTGKLSEVVERINDHVFNAKIRKVPSKDDPSVKFARLTLDPPKKN